MILPKYEQKRHLFKMSYTRWAVSFLQLTKIVDGVGKLYSEKCILKYMVFIWGTTVSGLQSLPIVCFGVTPRGAREPMGASTKTPP